MAQVADAQRNALQEVVLAFKEATVAVGAEGLQDADEGIEVVLLDPTLAFIAGEATDVEIVAEELVADGLRKVAFGTIEQRGNVVLSRAAAGPLVVNVVERR